MLVLQNVTVVYPDRTKAVDDVGFTLSEGENMALIGENGAGKTSLLLAVVGVLELSGGTIEIDGVRLGKKTLGEVRKKIGMVFQNPDDQLFMPRIYDDLAFGCRSHGMSEEETEARVKETLGRLSIGHLRERSSLKLSGGEKRMAAVATALVMEPSVLMLDEPTAFLDPKAKRALAGALKNLRHPKIIATHDMAFAAEVCDRVAVLKGGRLVADGGPALFGDEGFLRECGL